MDKGKKIRHDPDAESSDPELPGFLARPKGAQIYHGFTIVPETMTDGWVFGAIDEFESDEPVTEGDGFVIAPDGSPAGIAWGTDTPEFYEILPPDGDRWGVYGICFARPVSSADDLAFNFRRILPKLKEQYALVHGRSARRKHSTLIQLKEDERLVKMGAARHQRGGETVGGQLYLTNQRLIFETHKLNLQGGPTEIELANIQSSTKCWTKFLGLFPILPTSLTVYTKDGIENRFVLFRRKAWSTAIDAEKNA